jgi:hypothetical protein
MKVPLIILIVHLIFAVHAQQKSPKPLASHTPPKFKLSDTTGDWNQGNNYLDSLKQEFIQLETFKEINRRRAAYGMKPLVLDTGLRPAAVHNAIYNRWCLKNRIVQQPGDDCTMTHFQRVDMPGFTEIEFPMFRIRLLDQTRFASITEELTWEPIFNLQNKDTFKQRVDGNIFGFEMSEGHWYDITKDPKWDAIYIFYDLHYTGDTKSEHVCVFIILGDYIND